MLEIKINGSDSVTRIIIMGVGGTGNNAVNRMVDENTAGVESVDVNTDKQALQSYKVPTAMQIDGKLTKGLGAGARPDVGERAIEGSSEKISQALKGVGVVFVVCSMGGGTEIGAASVATKTAKDIGILTVGAVTRSFHLEAETRMSNTPEGIENLKNSVDTLIVVPNNRLLGIMDRRATMPDALKKADETLQQTVQGIMGLINVPGLINLDFADVQTTMIDKEIAHIGTDKARGNDKAIEAVKQAVSSPLLETTVEGASHIITNISDDISLVEVNEAASYIQELTGDEANIIFDAMHDENVQDEVSIIVIVTGLDEHDTDISMSNAMKEFTSSFKAKPSVVAATIQAPYAVAPEVTMTASSPYSRQNQSYIPSSNLSSSGSQGYNPPKYSLNQGYNTGSIQDPAPAPNQSFRPAANKRMQINIPDLLKNRR